MAGMDLLRVGPERPLPLLGATPARPRRRPGAFPPPRTRAGQARLRRRLRGIRAWIARLAGDQGTLL